MTYTRPARCWRCVGCHAEFRLRCLYVLHFLTRGCVEGYEVRW
jgi:hypothetical protein